ncbi:hypothetical protein BH09VER1_BH09VER1_40130 [soil metagenome]
MNFIIPLNDLETLFKGASLTRPKKTDTFTLSACAARVFVEFRGDVAGIEALVMSDGAVSLPAHKFREMIKTYKGTRALNFEGGPNGLKIQNFTMPILRWTPSPTPPAQFKVFQTTQPEGSTHVPPAR